MSGSLMLAWPLVLPNQAAASAICHIPMKEGVFFPKGLALPFQPALFSLPLLATSLLVLAARAEWQTALMAAASAAARMRRARHSGTRSFVRQQATRAWDLLSRDTALWKPGPCLTVRIRESKLRKGMLWPQGLFFVGTRRGDSNPGYLYAFHHVIPGPAVPPSHCMSLAELPSPSCPTLLAHIGLSSGTSCACRHGLNWLRGLHSSLSLSLLLQCWQLIYSQHCSVVFLQLWETMCQILLISLLTSYIWCIQSQPEALECMLLCDSCLSLVAARRLGWHRAESCSMLTSHAWWANWPWCGDQPFNGGGYTALCLLLAQQRLPKMGGYM